MSTSSPPSTAPHRLSGTLAALVRATVAYLDARLELLVIEGRDAFRITLRALVLATVASLSLGLAYTGAWIAATLWMTAHWWHGSLAPAVLCAALINALIALALALAASRCLRHRPLFQASRREFHEDHKWLTCHRPPPD